MKKRLAIALVMVLALSLLTACGGGNSNTPSGGNSRISTPPANNTPSDTTSGSDNTPSNTPDNSPSSTPSGADLINEWPKAIYDPYNIPAYTDGKIVCVDESPYSIPSANTAIEGSTVHIADASFDRLIAYVKDLRAADIGTVLDSAIEFLEEKEDDSGFVSFTLSDGKMLQISWWGYQDQQDFYLDGALEQVKYTYNVGISIQE